MSRRVSTSLPRRPCARARPQSGSCPFTQSSGFPPRLSAAAELLQNPNGTRGPRTQDPEPGTRNFGTRKSKANGDRVLRAQQASPRVSWGGSSGHRYTGSFVVHLHNQRTGDMIFFLPLSRPPSPPVKYAALRRQRPCEINSLC